MQRIMLRGKIHRATVTQSDLAYEGSCAIDEDLIEAAGMTVFERIELYNESRNPAGYPVTSMRNGMMARFLRITPHVCRRVPGRG